MIERQLSPRPLRALLPVLMDEQGLTYRGLAERTRAVDPRGRGLSRAFLNAVGLGLEVPGEEGIAWIAKSLGVPVASISEAVAARVREEFNYRARDPDEIARNVSDLLRLLEAAGDNVAPESSFVRNLRELRSG